MNKLKNSWGVLFFFGVIASITAYWYFFFKRESCNLYRFRDLTFEPLTISEQDEYPKTHNEEIDLEIIKKVQALIESKAIIVYSFRGVNDILVSYHYSKDKSNLELMPKMYKNSPHKTEIKCATELEINTLKELNLL